MTSHIDWKHHTVESLRELCREYAQREANLTAELATYDYIDYIQRTPGAWRIYGAIEHYLSKGYDADHIIKWLDQGYTKEEM